jgi:lipoprotein-anchoring transpeptidase ErfK/SrfK
MLNQHIVHLARMADVGTTVKVVREWFMFPF